MGVVYRAHDRELARDVALKLLLAPFDQEQVLRAKREAELTARLDHPRIVRIHAVESWQGAPYLIYELVEGARPFSEALEEPLSARLSLFRQTVAAVAHAHERGVVHRDLKQGNLLLDAEGGVRLVDFGVGWTAEAERLTQTGVLTGTPSHMAPEQAEGRRDAIGPATDVWALGVILYRLLTGQLPFQGQSTWTLLSQISSAKPTPPRALNPEVPLALEAVCLRALAKRPQERYPDAAALQADLERAERGDSLDEPARPRGGTRSAAGALGALAFLALLFAALLPRSRAVEGDRAPAPTPSPSAAFDWGEAARVALRRDQPERARAALARAPDASRRDLTWRRLAAQADLLAGDLSAAEREPLLQSAVRFERRRAELQRRARATTIGDAAFQSEGLLRRLAGLLPLRPPPSGPLEPSARALGERCQLSAATVVLACHSKVLDHVWLERIESLLEPGPRLRLARAVWEALRREDKDVRELLEGIELEALEASFHFHYQALRYLGDPAREAWPASAPARPLRGEHALLRLIHRARRDHLSKRLISELKRRRGDPRATWEEALRYARSHRVYHDATNVTIQQRIQPRELLIRLLLCGGLDAEAAEELRRLRMAGGQTPRTALLAGELALRARDATELRRLAAQPSEYPELLVQLALLCEDPSERERLLTQAEQRQAPFLFWRSPAAARQELAGDPFLAPLRR